ncbi:tyrosine-protein kinase family protein [Dysgonomonas sp. 520]|uniref:GumC family protein n=1 Tax=Dysgonomonas sp. 520 TaxID=2302931 RepID=UPI0013D85820|nr:tyrosine-protein kinase family protein [Dysgonomonas sp. 520]NDW09005.1 polysaccharide biosynthesis tyrosine autokinase [Dysgonomonas sp. 520]
MKKNNKNWQEVDNTTVLISALRGYIKKWKWFVLSLAICLTIGIYKVLTTERQYTASMKVMFFDDGNSSKNSNMMDLGALSLFAPTNNLNNELIILSSPDLIGHVVDSLNLQISYYKKGFFRKTEIFSESPFYVKLEKGEKEIVADFYIEKQGEGYKVEGSYAVDENEFDINQKIESFPDNILLSNDLGKIQIQKTEVKIDDSQKYYISIRKRASVEVSLSSLLSVEEAIKRSTILDVNIISSNSEKGAAILNELVRQYNIMNARISGEMANNTSLFINERLREISVELGDVEGDVVDYKTRNNITDLSSEAKLFIQQTGQNEQKLMEIETQLNVLSLIERFVNDLANRLNLIPNLGITDVALAQIITEYNAKLINYDLLIKNTGDENPARVRLVEDINNMRSSISSSLKNVKQAYLISKQDMQKMFRSNQSRIQSVPQQERGLLEKVRQQQIKESLFLFLMQKREENNITIASRSDKARIVVSPRIDTPPIAPQSKKILFIAFLIGLFVPILIIYLSGFFKTKISSRDDLEKLSEVNVVGQIGRSGKGGIAVQESSNSIVSEMFRSLRNNLNFILKHEFNKLIIVTSTISGEGKSFISLNLAISYALLGKKVLLIGADIRNPKLKEYANIKKKEGLTDYLVDPSNKWQDYIEKLNLNTDLGLDVMIAGAIPPNPNELLMTPKLKSFLSEVKREYDIVILDSAPVGLVSDTYLIDEHIDLTLYIVRENVTSKTAVNFINTQKEENKLHNMYLVLNDSVLDNSYKYGYGKAYGYGKIN